MSFFSIMPECRSVLGQGLVGNTGLSVGLGGSLGELSEELVT